MEEMHGKLVKTIGDSLMAVFRSSSHAVDFALELQRDPGHTMLAVRVGIHAGSVLVTESDVFGQTVCLAARVSAKANQGETLVTDAVKQEMVLLRAARHSGLVWIGKTGQELKGFEDTYTLWSIR